MVSKQNNIPLKNRSCLTAQPIRLNPERTQVIGMPTTMLNCDVIERNCSMTSRPSSMCNVEDIQTGICSHTFVESTPPCHLRNTVIFNGEMLDDNNLQSPRLIVSTQGRGITLYAFALFISALQIYSHSLLYNCRYVTIIEAMFSYFH